MINMTPSQAFWLGHLYQASEQGLSLAVYADAQNLKLSELLLWRRRLQVAGVALPEVKSSLFTAVEVVA